MKKKDLNELKNKTPKELLNKLSSLKNELVNTNLELKMGRVKNVHEVASKRKDIARILTFMKMRSFEELKESKKEQTKEKQILTK